LRARYILSRSTQSVITLLAVLTLLWVLFRALPGDPAGIYISGRLSPQDIEALRESFGLNEPLYIQYVKYMRSFFSGNFGVSFHYREPAMQIIGPRLFNTVMLMGPAMIMAIICGSFIGSYLGWRRGSKREKIGAILSLSVRAFPIYLSGIIALMIFSHYLGWFPLGGMRTIGGISFSWVDSFLDITHHMLLPLIVAFLYFIGDIVVISRTSMLELIGEEFLDFAKAKGLGDRKVRRIARRNAIIPVITYATVMIGFAFGGQVLLEIVFSWPGLGRLLVNSVTRHDYPVAQAAFFIMATAVIIGNFIVDILYGYLDPRITYEKKG